MRSVKLMVHRVASVAEVRALEAIGIRVLGVSLLKDPALADGRGLAVSEVVSILNAVRDARVVVECTPEQTFALPADAHRRVFLWSDSVASPLLLNRAVDMGYRVVVGPVAVDGFFDLELGPAMAPGVGWEYQIRGGEPGALGDTIQKPGIFNKIREIAAELDVFVGMDVAPKTVGVARISLKTAGHAFAIGHPRRLPACRHHQSVGQLFDTLAALGFPALADAALSALETADIARRQQGRLQFARREALTAGKEPFDLKRFQKLYDVTGDNTAYLSIEEQVSRWEERYYLQAKQVMTLVEFAEVYRKMVAFR